MTPQIRNWIKSKVESGVIPRTGHILECGSRNVNGSIREFFDQTEYMGIDIEEGEGVDEVENIHDVIAAAVSYYNYQDLVICLETIEHDPDPIGAVRTMVEILKPGGILVLSAPTTGFPEHKHPKDYWRFMKDAWHDIFFVDMDILALDEVRCPAGYPGLIGCARKR